MTLASGGSPMFPLVVHQPASPSIWPAVQSLQRGLSTNPGRQCGAYVGAVEEMMSRRGNSGDGCVLASTLCKYDLRKGDLFVLSWARVLRVRRGSISSELLVCGGGVRSILLLPLVARCQETIDVCIWRMFVFMSVVVTVLGSVGMFLCSGRC